MSIRVKYSQLSKEALESLNYLVSLDINVDCVLKLTKLIKELGLLIEDRVKLESNILDKWVDRNSDGTPKLAVDNDGNIIDGYYVLMDADKFNEEMVAVSNLEVDIHMDRIKLLDLGVDKLKIRDIIHIDYLFE
jgi:hypothetical protein